jgi:beta-phosphoglucomutase-like phosphatase (HAD superfamily)
MEEDYFMVRYLLFDFDGTLVDSLNVIIEAYNQLAGKYKANKMEQKDIAYMHKDKGTVEVSSERVLKDSNTNLSSSGVTASGHRQDSYGKIKNTDLIVGVFYD